MLGYLLNSNVMVELSLNPTTWFIIPKVETSTPTPAFPSYRGFNVKWLFIRVYTYIDNGRIDVRAMYEQQEREQNFVAEA